MAITIAISGKGGSGKTTLAAMIIRILLKQAGSKSILAVDADPNACLGAELGVEPAGTIAEIREQARTKSPNSGMDRVRTFEYKMQQAITEASGFDLLTMGRPEGPDCYCAVNNILRTFLDKLSSQYQFVIIDCEAGMEHLSRRTTNNIDFLYIVTESTSLGVVTAQRIFDLAKGLPILVKKIGVIWNKMDAIAGGNQQLKGVEVFGNVPYDKAVFDASMQGQSIFELDDKNPAYLAVQRIIASKLNP